MRLRITTDSFKNARVVPGPGGAIIENNPHADVNPWAYRIVRDDTRVTTAYRALRVEARYRDITITLPTAAKETLPVYVRLTDTTKDAVLVPTGTDKIDGGTSLTMDATNAAVILLPMGDGWWSWKG